MHRTIRLGAGIAYYGLFALIPILALSLAVAGLVVSDADVQSYLEGRLEDVFGPEAAGFSSAIASVLGDSGTIAGLGLISIGALVLAASLVVLSLQDALNTIWEMPVRSGFRQTLLRRLGAFAVILSAGLVLILGFVINAITARDRAARARCGDPRIGLGALRRGRVMGARGRRVRPAVPLPARHPCAVVGGAHRRRDDHAARRRRHVGDRVLPAPLRRVLGDRRDGRRRAPAPVDLLRGADHPRRSGVHAGRRARLDQTLGTPGRP